jgi:hypothetical protein
MRLLTLSLFLATAALMAGGDSVSAQSPTSYPWCSRGTKGVPGNCYYASKEQCQRTISGNGVYCMRNPWYGNHLPTAPGRAEDRADARANGVRSLNSHPKL